MLNIAMSSNWEEWQEVVSGTGTLDVTNGVLSVDADDISSAYLRYNIEINPNERVVFECDALATDIDTAPVLAIDNPVGTQKVQRIIKNNTLQNVSISYQPYFNENGMTTVSILVGTYSSVAGAGKFANPRLRIETPSMGNDRLIGRGLINFNGTGQAVTMSGNHQSFGLDLALETYAIRVTPSDITTFQTNRRPQVKATQCTDGQNNSALVWSVSAPDTSGSFILQAHRLASGSLVNLSTETANRAIFVEVTI